MAMGEKNEREAENQTGDEGGKPLQQRVEKRGSLSGRSSLRLHQLSVTSNPSSPNRRLISGAKLKLLTAAGERVTSKLMSPPSDRILCSNAPWDLLRRTAYKARAPVRFRAMAASICSCVIASLSGSANDGLPNHDAGLKGANQ